MKDFPAAKKSLGQHFLTDRKTIDKIIKACDLSPKDRVLEIGPGRGALTYIMADIVGELNVVEKDKVLAARLNDDARLDGVNVFCEDILDFELKKIKEPFKVIGNLPYNIATPIIEKIINNRNVVTGAYVMVQLEHGQRLLAKPNTKDYGSLSCFVQYYADLKKVLTIKKTCFSPPPKVDSCFIEFKFLEKPRYACADEELLFKFIRAAFNYRRKTLLNSLSLLFPKEAVAELLQESDINPRRRAEDLTLSEYVVIVNQLAKSNGSFIPNL